MKTLFMFKNSGSGANYQAEIFADNLTEAHKEYRRLTESEHIPSLLFVTQNHSCPKCSCNATECNYQ